MKIELCSASTDALRLAHKFNFDRVELCQSLEVGGLTPSLGLIHKAIQYQSFETHILIRNRAGGFVYSSSELENMLLEIHLLSQFSVQGFVIGALGRDLKLDLNWLKEAKKIAPKLQWTCHRAFDDLDNWEEAMEQLIELGFTRILSAGLQTDVNAGFETLINMRSRSFKRIELMCGGGINKTNASVIQNQIKPDSIHFSGTIEQRLDEKSLFSTTALIVSEQKIEEILRELR